MTAAHPVAGITGSAAPPRWRIGLAYLLALYPAGVLLFAAFFKAGDPVLFAEQITAHRVTPDAWSTWLAFFFIAVEFILGAALIAFVWPRLTFVFTILLMLGFIGVTAWAWMHHNISDCGCFGRMIDRGPQAVIIEDAFVIAAALLGIWLARGARTTIRRQRLFAGLLMPAILLIAFGTTLPIDGVVVGVRRGTDLSDLSVQGAPVSIEDGTVLLAVIGDDCPACVDGLPQLKELAAQGAPPQLVGVFSGEPAAALAWRLKHRPNFALATGSERVMRQYYRRLPAVFLLEQGIVRKTWWGRFPSGDEARRALSG